MTSLLLFFWLLQGQRVIPATGMSIPAKLATTHAKIVWTDKNGNQGVSILTDAEYKAIGNGVPSRPPTFPGPPQDWIDCWQGKPGAGHAVALGGRPDVNTPSKEHRLGTVMLNGTGSWVLFLGDQDIDPVLVINQADITSGTMPAAVVMKCGLVSTPSGVIAGNLDIACAKVSGK